MATTIITTDNVYRNFAFQVNISFTPSRDIVMPDGSTLKAGTQVTITGGFSQSSTPEVNFDTAEFRAGDQSLFRKKFVGLPMTNDLTMQRGFLTTDTGSLLYLLQWLEDTQEILDGGTKLTHYHPTEYTEYQLKDAYIGRIRVASDMDSTSNEVSLSEFDIRYRTFSKTTVSGDNATKMWSEIYDV